MICCILRRFVAYKGMPASLRPCPSVRAASADRLGVRLSALCAVHCVASVALVGSVGAALLNPLIHEVGLALAVLLGAVAFAGGLARHARIGPMLLGGGGLATMAAAIGVRHGPAEAALTVAGVLLLSAGHLWNGRIASAGEPLA